MTKSYLITTIGCQMNKSDSERIAGYLEKKGYKKASSHKEADLIFVNTCGVRQSAEDRLYGLLPKYKKENPNCNLVLTGCLSERDDIKKKLNKYVDEWLPIGELPNFDFCTSQPSAKKNKQSDNISYLKENAKHASEFMAFIPIGNGCNNFCSYCVVPYARGREHYRKAEDIINEIKDLVERGYKEINLIAQNVNSYLDNRKYQFSNLLRDVNEIAGEFWIRFATSHPKDMSDELINAIAECDKVCEHVHLPVQAGDDKVLSDMNRKYKVSDYKNLIYKLRERIPGVAISTDIIVGFPGESKEQFKHTIELSREIKFDQIYIAQYSPRPGTAAAKLKDDVAKTEKKQRDKELTKVLEEGLLEINKGYIGKEIKVLILNKKYQKYLGRTRTNKMVAINGAKDSDFTGRIIQVKITGAQTFGLSGILK